MQRLAFLVYFCICISKSVGCPMTTDTCRKRPGVKLNATPDEKFITSPGFPDNYANHLNCYWMIRNTDACGLIRIDVKAIEFEWKFDKLRFDFGSSETYVNSTSVHSIPGESVAIRFTSDHSKSRGGFKLSYSIKGCTTTDTCKRWPSVTLDATSTEQFITSPGFPNHYADDLFCNWTIRNTAACGLIHIDVTFIELEWNYDKLRFRYGSSEMYVYSTSVHAIPGESVAISFTSDGSTSLGGFKLSYRITAIDVKATSTKKYISSPGFPHAYHHNILCRWNIANSNACSLLRLDTIVVETEDRLDTPTIKYEGGLHILSNRTYYIPSNQSVLQFKTDGSVTKRGFNMSYEAEDIQIVNKSSVFGCKDFQLLAEAKLKYVFSPNHPKKNMDTECNWMIFAAVPCTTTDNVNESKISVVVEEFKSNGSSPITIFQAQSSGSVTIHVSQESSLVGQPFEFNVRAEEFVLIAVRHIGQSSVFKLSYKVMKHNAETERQSHDTFHVDNTALIATASTIGIVCIVTVILHILIHLICRKRSSQTKQSDTIIFHNEIKDKTKRPYVDIGIEDQSASGHQPAASSTDDIYDGVGDDEGLETNKHDYYNMDRPSAENEIYMNTSTTNVRPESDLYEEINSP